MIRGKIAIAVFALMAFAQWVVPGSMILQHERTLTQGEEWKFRCQLLDPYDPFRGRYVMIDVSAGGVDTEGMDLPWSEKVYVSLERDDEGYAKYGAVSTEQPADGAYLLAQVYGSQVVFPLNRFYMQEDIAPEAERVYFDATRSEELRAYVTVRILDGHAVLEQLYIDDTPVADYVRAQGS
ncbi:MAG: hypothetical protein GC168_16320 [Candidatus Hydrogenedens sp.]|nr:hypothetical protein [Candidatus Hydrogenedens sp.]